MHLNLSRYKKRLNQKIKETSKSNREKFILPVSRRKLTNSDFTILANTCIGGIIYHDMNMKFLSPTINLYIRPDDFVRFLENLDHYLKAEITQYDIPGLKYPVGKLDDIIIFFKHYSSLEEAILKWNERKTRINYDNLFIMMTDRWCCSRDALQRFEKLPFSHKVCFTAKEYPEFASCRRVRKNNDDNVCVGVITDVVSITGKRLYEYADNFNYIDWINKKGE
ncbi:MAG: DUF1919 domain-containing protein [Oscillospiraceae bacterium]|nr:DUF1919 domain-containing protein [Oscillospiraceae bacterium]